MNELRKLAKARDIADIKDVAVNVAGRVAGQLGERVAQEKVSQLVDRLADRLNAAIKDAGLDPISVPEASVTFAAQVGCLPLPGNARLHDGGVRGLATVRRHQPDGLAVRVEAGSRVFVDLALAVGPVTAGVTGDVTVCCCLGAAPVFTVTCEAVVLRLSFNGDLAERRFEVTEFRLDELPELRPEVAGVDGGAMRAWIQPLVDRVGEDERARLEEAAKAKVMELAKEFIQNPQSLAALM